MRGGYTFMCILVMSISISAFVDAESPDSLVDELVGSDVPDFSPGVMSLVEEEADGFEDAWDSVVEEENAKTQVAQQKQLSATPRNIMPQGSINNIEAKKSASAKADAKPVGQQSPAVTQPSTTAPQVLSATSSPALQAKSTQNVAKATAMPLMMPPVSPPVPATRAAQVPANQLAVQQKISGAPTTAASAVKPMVIAQPKRNETHPVEPSMGSFPTTGAAAAGSAAPSVDAEKMADAQQAAKTAASAIKLALAPKGVKAMKAAQAAISNARASEMKEKSKRRKELMDLMKFEPVPVQPHDVQQPPPEGWAAWRHNVATGSTHRPLDAAMQDLSDIYDRSFAPDPVDHTIDTGAGEQQAGLAMVRGTLNSEIMRAKQSLARSVQRRKQQIEMRATLAAGMQPPLDTVDSYGYTSAPSEPDSYSSDSNIADSYSSDGGPDTYASDEA